MVGLFPDMLFLDVVRDPRAQVSSMNRAIIYDFDTVLNTMRWVASREWADRLREKYPEKVLTIRYEDFILDQERTLRAVCQFVGIPFSPVVLDVQLSQEAYQMSSRSPLWKTNFADPIPHHIHKYQDRLTRGEVEHIETLTGKWMQRYGYPFQTPHQSVLPYDNDTALQHSNEKKEMAWSALKQGYPYDYVLRRARARFLKNLHEFS
jgi:hypothetical protein